MLAVAAGCGDESDLDDARAVRAEWCYALCDVAARCDPTTASGCAVNCMTNSSGLSLRLTQAAIEAQTDCLAQVSSCADGIEVVLDACTEEAFSSVAPTQASADACQLMSKPLFECRWFGSLEECATFAAAFTPAALQSWQSCSGIDDCAGLGECTSATLYSYGE